VRGRAVGLRFASRTAIEAIGGVAEVAGEPVHGSGCCVRRLTSEGHAEHPRDDEGALPRTVNATRPVRARPVDGLLELGDLIAVEHVDNRELVRGGDLDIGN
jgi:hypothetical protein